MLGEVVGKVISPTTPMDVKSPLAFNIFLPIKTHVYGFRMALFYGAIDDSIDADFLKLKGRDWFGMEHIGDDSKYHVPLFGI